MSTMDSRVPIMKNTSLHLPAVCSCARIIAWSTKNFEGGGNFAVGLSDPILFLAAGVVIEPLVISKTQNFYMSLCHSSIILEFSNGGFKKQ